MFPIAPTTILLTLVPAVINLGIALYSFIFLPRHRNVILFGLLTTCMAFWQVADAMFMSAPDMKTAIYFDRFFAFSWCFGGALAFHFACSYTNAPVLRHRWFYLSYLPFFVTHRLYMTAAHTEMEHHPFWGWVNGAGTGWTDELTLWLLGTSMLLVVIMLTRHAWRIRSIPVRGPQALLIAIGMLVPTLAGILFQVIFPLVLKRQEIPLTSGLMTIFSLATIIALVRYRLFDITESVTLETVLHQFQNIVLVVLPDRQVQFLNAYTGRLFGTEGPVRVPLQTLFASEEAAHDFEQQVLAPAFEGRSLRNNMVVFNKGDRRLVTLVAAEPLRITERAQGVLIVANDITEYLMVLEERQRAEKELEEAQLRRHREITEAVLAAQENERRIIGAELHDNVNQILTSARLYLGLASTESHNRESFTRQADDIVGKAMTEVRKLSHTLIPPSWSGETLVEALRHLLSASERSNLFEVTLDADRFNEDQVSGKLKLALYRIVQEQLNNIIRHAAASSVQITIRQYRGQLLLHVRDDGRGFDTRQQSFGIGLKNIETRVSLHSGTMEVQSSPGNGCLLTASFPLAAAVPEEGSPSQKNPR